MRPTRFSRSLTLILLLALATPGLAQNADGLFVSVENPINSLIVGRVVNKVESARRRTDPPIRVIVFDFNPGNNAANTVEYGPCLDLAKFIRSLRDVTTVAFVPNQATGHTVLPILACQEIVMGPTAHIGRVLSPEHRGPPDDDHVAFYRKMAGDARAAVVLKMLDAKLPLLVGQKDGASYYVDGRQRVEAEKLGVVNLRPVAMPSVEAETTALYPAIDAEKLGLVRRKLGSRPEVAEAYGLSPASLRDDPLQGRPPIVWKLTLRGQVTPVLEERLTRQLKRAVAKKANVLILQIQDCGGGDTAVARSIADYLRRLKDDTGQEPVMTIAYVPFDAPDTAAFIALGCTEIVMGRNATLGDFAGALRPPVKERRAPRRGPAPPPPLPQAGPADPERVRVVKESLRELLREQNYPVELAEAMLETSGTFKRVHRLGQPGLVRLMTPTQLEEANADRAAWQDDGDVKADGSLLVLNAALASDLGVARFLVDVPADPRDLSEVLTRYGFDPSRIHEAGPDWLDRFAEFLRRGEVSFFLILIGFACLILEAKMPGLGVPGVVAALCFVLFFWAYLGADSEVVWLAVMLFVLGLILLGIEIFLIPGFGFIGISGVLLILIGLGLATLQKMPQTSKDWMDLGGSLTIFGGSLLGAGIAAIFIARWLPHIPMANRLVLAPATDETNEDTSPGIAPEVAALLGAVGVSATPLRPAGMAQFGDRYVDVVTEGSFVPPGARVQVIEIEGHRIVVKEV